MDPVLDVFVFGVDPDFGSSGFGIGRSGGSPGMASFSFVCFWLPLGFVLWLRILHAATFLYSVSGSALQSDVSFWGRTDKGHEMAL